MSQEPTPKVRGRRTKLTPEIQTAICDAIRSTKLPIQDAARILNLDPSTIFGWIARGKAEGRGKFFAFSVAIAKARSEGSQILLARIAKAGSIPQHWAAAAHLLTITEPHLAPKVRLEVTRQLSDVIKRVTEKFSDRPALLEEVLEAIAGGPVDDETA